MSTHFKEDKERITCTGGSLDGRELWITKGLGVFVVLGRGGERETFARDGETFVLSRVRKVEEMPEAYVRDMPCSQ